jgi:arylsulfatase A-like enzyme
MFLKAPGLQPRIDDGDFQLIDLMPTIIDAAGIPTSTVPKIDGRSALKAVGKLRKRSFILKTFGESIDVGLPVRRIIVESK